MSFGVEARVLERGQGRLVREIARRLVVGRDVPMLDAGAALDPLVRGLDHLLEIRVGEDSLR